jgi:hypothetical protein
MKRYCDRRGCFKQHEEEEMQCVSEKGGRVKLYFCRDTDCLEKYVASKTIRTAYRKNVYANNFQRYSGIK